MKAFFKIVQNICLIIPVYYFNSLQAQSKISGTVNNGFAKSLANANVLLLTSSDSTLVKGVLTDNSGLYIFQNVAPGKYFIKASYTGFEQSASPLFSIENNRQNIDLGTLNLSQKEVQLSEVKIAVKKPLLEQKIDRLVINVENSITSAGSTALEVLERSPGVIVDHQNNLISMNGKDGVVLMINGKINRMPVSAVVQLLSGMNSGNIEKIELITTPPANLDAQGNAGYINIVLKENNNYGTNGSYAVTAGYQKGPVSQASINLNHRQGKINLYGDFSFSRIKKPFPINAYSRISNNGNISETYYTAKRTDTTIGLNGRLGMDYQLNNRTIIGILFTGNQRRYTQSEKKESFLFKNQIPDSLAKFSNSELNNWKNYSINLNTQHNFKQDENLSLNLDYIHYINKQPVNYFTAYYNSLGQFAYDQTTRSGKATLITFWVGALDYSARIGKQVTMEAGIKETISGFRNNISFERLSQNIWNRDGSLSANYKLNETYSAAYSSFNITINKSTEAKLGFRYEYTNTNLGTQVTKNIVDRKYGNLFPSIFLSHKLNETNKINLSYNLRINRPAFTDLAPFTYYIDANTLITGNPALQASITNTLKADYLFKSYLFSVSYSKEDKAITGFQPASDSILNKVTFSPQNLINKKTVSAVFSLPVTVTKWWTMQYNISGFWQQSNLIYKKEQLQLAQLNVNIRASENFSLPKQFSIELSGFYQSPFLDGILIREAFGSLDVGIKKKLNGKNGALLFSASNILNTLYFAGHANLPEQNLVQKIHVQFSQPIYRLTYTQNFGKEKLRGNRSRSTGAEDEKGRVRQ